MRRFQDYCLVEVLESVDPQTRGISSLDSFFFDLFATWSQNVTEEESLETIKGRSGSISDQ